MSCCWHACGSGREIVSRSPFVVRDAPAHVMFLFATEHRRLRLQAHEHIKRTRCILEHIHRRADEHFATEAREQHTPQRRPQQRQHGRKRQSSSSKEERKREIILRHPLTQCKKTQDARIAEIVVMSFSENSTVANGTPFFCAKHGDKDIKRSGNMWPCIYG